MQRESDRTRLFGRRAALLAGGKMLLLSALVGRMYYLQVVQSEKYVTLAEDNRINLRLLPPPRGLITDRFGVPVATNQQNYRVLLTAENTHDVEMSLDILGKIVPIAPHERRRILREVKRHRSFVPVTLKENLSWDEVARIELNIPDLPGLSTDVGQTRFYPYGAVAAHFLGYVSAASEAEIDGDPLLTLPGFRIGKAGAEKVHDRKLRGIGGSSEVEVNAFGRVIRELARNEGQPGSEIQLTIDIELQRMVTARVSEESASAVVMDVHNGDVLAMVSTPAFDPNAFAKGLTGEQWQELVGNPMAPLTNKTIAAQYAPGSTFKGIVALAALEKGLATPATRASCIGYVALGDAKFHCWKKGGHGSLDMLGGIAQSCDVYFYELARRTGIERIAAMARKFGMGTNLGIDLPNEQPGLIPSREWKRAVTGEGWSMGETMILGIGQGYILTTPLQLAVMGARLVNGGLAVKPRLARGAATSAPGAEPGFENMGISPQNLAFVRSGFDTVVNDRRGTAYNARIKVAGFEMGGKTGSVQVRRISKAERETGIRKNKDLPWKERDHALFVGYAPIRAPRYVAAVVVEHGGGGAAVAAPIVRDILLEAQKRGSAQPRTRQQISQAPDFGRPGGDGG